MKCHHRIFLHAQYSRNNWQLCTCCIRFIFLTSLLTKMRIGTKTVPSTWYIFNVTDHVFTFLVVLSLICLVTTQMLICGNKTIWRLEILLRTIVAALLRTKCNGGFVKNKRYQETGKEYFTIVQIIVKDFAARATFDALSCPTSPPSAPQTHTHTHQQKGHCLPDDLSSSHLQPTYKHILHIVLWHFQRCWQREFVNRSKASFVGDHFLHSHDLNVWYCREKFNACHS